MTRSPTVVPGQMCSNTIMWEDQMPRLKHQTDFNQRISPTDGQYQAQAYWFGSCCSYTSTPGSNVAEGSMALPDCS